MLAVLAGSFRFIERSSLFSDLFCVLLVVWLLPAERLTRGLLFRLTVLFLLWVQLHPGYPLGLALLALWVVWRGEWRRAWWLALPLVALVANPEGLSGALYPFHFALNEARTLKSFNFEWFPSYHPAFRLTPEVIAFWVLCLASLMLLWRERAWRCFRGALVVFAIMSAAQVVRFIPWASFALLIALKPWSTTRHLPLARPAWTLVIASVLVLVAIKNFGWGYMSSSGSRKAQLSLDPKFFPAANLEFLRKNRIPGRLYNSHDFGSYLAWSGERPIFHHGFVTDMDFYRNDVIGALTTRERFLELARKHGWTMLLVDKHGGYRQIHRILSPIPEWRIVSEDEASYLIYLLP